MSGSMEERYPEHAKLQGVQHESQAIGEFLDWCEDVKGLVLGGDTPRTDLATNRLLAEFYKIDYTKLMAEKDAMYAEMVEMQSNTKPHKETTQ